MDKRYKEQYQQLEFDEKDTNVNHHILAKAEPREEGGVTAAFKIGYQNELATLACVLMLFPGSGIKSVAVELHEDYVIEHENGTLDFRQVKHKDEGQVISVGTMSKALKNLYFQYKEFSDSNCKFTLECNLGASSGRNDDNLLELKKLLSKERDKGLDSADENRLTLLTNNIAQSADFKGENPASVGEFVRRLNISTNLGDVAHIKNQCKNEIEKYLCARQGATTLDLKVRDKFYDEIYLLVERATREREHREKRVIYRDMLEKIVPGSSNLAELSTPIPPDQEYFILDDVDPAHTILEYKCNNANLSDAIEDLVEAKTSARIRSDHYRANTVALNYINYLRKSIKQIDTEEKINAKQHQNDQKSFRAYVAIMRRLEDFSQREKHNDVSVRVDPLYLKGLYAQLVSECPIKP